MPSNYDAFNEPGSTHLHNRSEALRKRSKFSTHARHSLKTSFVNSGKAEYASVGDFEHETLHDIAHKTENGVKAELPLPMNEMANTVTSAQVQAEAVAPMALAPTPGPASVQHVAVEVQPAKVAVEVKPAEKKHVAIIGSGVVLSERDGGYYYYHVNFALTLALNVVLLVCNAANVFASQWDLNTIANFMLANLLVCVFVRNELYLNGLYWVVTRTPHVVPLCIRKRLARWVFSQGGYHSGTGLAVGLWVVYMLVALQRKAIIHKYEGLWFETVFAYVITIFIGIVLWFASIKRAWRHNLFELSHRWLGWATLGFSWALVGVVAGRDASNTGYWIMLAVTLLVITPWTRVYKVPVKCTKPSGHAVMIEFHDAAPIAGTFGRISHHPVGEYHTFATITPDPAQKMHYMIIAGAGDWTKDLIAHPPDHLYVRGIRTPGFMNTIRMFRSTVVVATGAGVAPCLPFMMAKDHWPQIVHVIWATRNPRVTFGDLICDTVESMPSVTIWDSAVNGRPKLEELVVEWCVKKGAEAAHIVANEPMTLKCVSACRKHGVNCLGAIWDS